MFEVILRRIRELSESTRDFQFVRQDGQQLDYKPGQFYRFVFEDDEGEFERSYSLCNYEDLYGDTLDLVISRVVGGRATRLLFNCSEGLTAKVTGPFGRLVLPEVDPGRLIMVATSVGLAPYMPMLRELETREISKVVLLLGVRDRTEFIYGDLLRRYAGSHDFFDLRFCISREAPVADDEFAGYVTEQLQALAPDPDSDHVLLCGNPAMIDDAWGYLKELNFRPKKVVREKYVFAREKKAASSALTDDQKKLIAEKMKKYS
ncbi:MAG: ferredoxin--NADP reductase [Pseudomonadales bacterium]|nr:ferredoxin--NADP reductase [Pseudomonadales bacterium]